MFRVGDKVEWTSGAGRGYKTKIGEVVFVVPYGTSPREKVFELIAENKWKSAYGYGLRRDHESYLVLVPHHGKGRPSLYWPRVSKLRAANER